MRFHLIPAWVPPALVLIAVPFMRPNLMGESQSLLGSALAVLAAVLVLLQRRSAAVRPPAGRSISPAAQLILLLGLGYFWCLVQASVVDPGALATAALQSVVLTVGTLMAVFIVCQDRRNVRIIARGFLIVLIVMCSSYAITAAIWAVAGVGAGQVATVPISTWGPQPLYFPFTTTAATQTAFGIRFPRFTGIGREPGWMAMYCAIGFFLADLLGFRSRRVKAVLLLGLLGCVSTAGFGVFVVVWAYHRFLRARGGISMANYFRQVGGILAVAGAAYLAVTAPVLGLSAKSTQNAESLDDRTNATQAGVTAFFDNPLGGDFVLKEGGINLVSDVAVDGLPFVVLVVAGILATLRRPSSGQFSSAIMLVVLFTLITSQPPKDSTWAYGVIVMASLLLGSQEADQRLKTTSGDVADERP